MTVDQFILSAAYQYLLNHGWTEDEFHYFNTSADCGIDSVLQRFQKTHGEQSDLMTICEKYVWQSRNEIYGFLADRLLYQRDSDVPPCIVTNYLLLDDFINPLHDLNIAQYSAQGKSDSWYIPEKEKVFNDTTCTSPEALADLIKNVDELNVSQWIQLENKSQFNICSENLTVLHAFSCFEGKSGIEYNISINCLMADPETIPALIRALTTDETLLYSLNLSELTGGYVSSCYLTPKEIVDFPWIKRTECSFSTENPSYKLIATTDSCTSHHFTNGDMSYYFPSQQLRNYLNICKTDGNIFQTSDNTVVAEFSKVGESWGVEQQLLLVDYNKLTDVLFNDNKALVWIFTESCRESIKAKERLGKFYAEKQRVKIAYFKGKKLCITTLSDSFESRI